MPRPSSSEGPLSFRAQQRFSYPSTEVPPEWSAPTPPHGIPVVHASTVDLGPVLDGWLAEPGDGTACVIGAEPVRPSDLRDGSRVRSMTPELAKGLEFDLVVLIDPESYGDGVVGAVDRYVAMTRATQRLVILTSA